MSEWEPDDEKLVGLFADNLNQEFGHTYRKGRIQIAKGIVAMYRDHLASLVGNDPCPECGCEHFEDPCEYRGDCGKYGFHQGQLAQAAKGQQLLQEAKAETERYRRALEELCKLADSWPSGGTIHRCPPDDYKGCEKHADCWQCYRGYALHLVDVQERGKHE